MTSVACCPGIDTHGTGPGSSVGTCARLFFKALWTIDFSYRRFLAWLLPLTQVQPGTQPDTMANDLSQATMALVRIGYGRCVHVASMPHETRGGEVGRFG